MKAVNMELQVSLKKQIFRINYDFFNDRKKALYTPFFKEGSSVLLYFMMVCGQGNQETGAFTQFAFNCNIAVTHFYEIVA